MVPSRDRVGLSILLLSLAPGIGSAQSSFETGDIQLQPGDQILIEIKDENGLSGTFTVDANGEVLLPALGIVTVIGRSFNVVRDDLVAAYGKQLVDPIVRVTPLQRVAVLGEVMRPGLFPVDPTHRVSDLLALAGGFTQSANRNRVTLVRKGETVAVRVDPDAATLAIPLRSGDQLIVGRRGWLDQNSPIVIGAIASIAAAAVTALVIR